MSIVQERHLKDIWGEEFTAACEKEAKEYFGTSDVGAITVMAVQRLREAGGEMVGHLERLTKLQSAKKPG